MDLFRAALNQSDDPSLLSPAATAEAWFGVGYCLYGLLEGFTAEQASCYEQALAHDPNHALAHANLGISLMVLRNGSSGGAAASCGTGYDSSGSRAQDTHDKSYWGKVQWNTKQS